MNEEEIETLGPSVRSRPPSRTLGWLFRQVQDLKGLISLPIPYPFFIPLCARRREEGFRFRTYRERPRIAGAPRSGRRRLLDDAGASETEGWGRPFRGHVTHVGRVGPAELSPQGSEFPRLPAGGALWARRGDESPEGGVHLRGACDVGLTPASRRRRV